MGWTVAVFTVMATDIIICPYILGRNTHSGQWQGELYGLWKFEYLKWSEVLSDRKYKEPMPNGDE